MLLECPFCHKEMPVEPGPPTTSPRRLTCTHCNRTVVLDQYTGRLMPDRKQAQPRKTPAERYPQGATAGKAFFEPRLSTGRDTLAAVFVIVCIVAIGVGGVSLVTGMRSATIDWSGLRLAPVIEKIEDAVARYLAGGPFSSRAEKDRHLRRGRSLVKKEAYAEALRELDKAIAARPDSYEAHFWRGRALVKTGREAEAIRAFETTIELNPRYSYAYDNLGWIYLRRNQYETSLEYLNQSLALRPENGWALYNRGRILFQKGHVDEAFQDAEAACRLGFTKACQLLKRHGREIQS